MSSLVFIKIISTCDDRKHQSRIMLLSAVVPLRGGGGGGGAP